MPFKYGGLRSGANPNDPIEGKDNLGNVEVEIHPDGRITGPNGVGLTAALTAQDASVVDSTYGAAEAGVIDNNRTRIAELEARLQEVGLLA